MRLFIFGPDLAIPQPVWMNIFYPEYKALSESVPTTFLPMPKARIRQGRIQGVLKGLLRRRPNSSMLIKRTKENLDACGPNILLVYALNAGDVKCSSLLDDVWNEFDYCVLNLVDTVQPDHLPKGSFSRFDLVLSGCSDLAEQFFRETKVPSLFFPLHCDVLSNYSLRDVRPLDLLLVGRRDKKKHAPLHNHFNAPERERIFLDFVTRTQSIPLPEDEFRLLMATYSRSKAAFCYEPSQIGRFRGRSPLTARWVHAWASGCTVLGTAPTSPSALEQMDWPEATIELPLDPEAAIEAVEAVLSDVPALGRRRRRNVVEALSRHDTRLRLSLLLQTLDLSLPQTLVDQLERLHRTTREVNSLS